MAWCVPHIPFSPEPEYSRALRLRDVAVCALQGNQSLTDFMAKKAPVTEPPLVISTFDESKTNINYPKDLKGCVLMCVPAASHGSPATSLCVARPHAPLVVLAGRTR